MARSTGYIYFLKAVVPLEISQTVGLFLPVRETCVPQVGNSSRRARPDRLGNECVGGGFVPMLDHRNDLHQPGLHLFLITYEFYETDQGVLKVGTIKILRSMKVPFISWTAAMSFRSARTFSPA